MTGLYSVICTSPSACVAREACPPFSKMSEITPSLLLLEHQPPTFGVEGFALQEHKKQAPPPDLDVS